MQVPCQNPDFHQRVVLNLPNTAMVRDVGLALAKEFQLVSAPVLYAYLKREAAVELSRRTLVDGERVILPDDLSISEVLKSLRDPGTPINFQTLDITQGKLFALRTQRFQQLNMYDVAKLQNARVLIGGAGLLGSEIAANLATLGVGTLYVIDNGFVDWLNVYRQALLTKADVYKRKVDVVKQYLEEMGGVSVKALPLEVPWWRSSLDSQQMKHNLSLLDQAVMECDLVIGAFDKFSPRAVLQFFCLIRNRPFLTAALEPGLGQINLFEEQRKTGCYCCGFPDPRRGRWYDGGACTLATLESQRIVAALATKLAVDRLDGKELSVNEIIYNVLTMSIEAHTRSVNPLCSLCGPSGIVKSHRGDATKTLVDWIFHKEPAQT